MKETLEPKRCGAKTRSGSPCAKYPIAGKRRCRNHGSLSTGPRTKEGRARIAAANTRHGKYRDWREHRAKEKIYFSEIRRILKVATAAFNENPSLSTVTPVRHSASKFRHLCHRPRHLAMSRVITTERAMGAKSKHES